MTCILQWYPVDRAYYIARELLINDLYFTAVSSGQSLLHCQRVADDRENLQERSRSDHCGKVLPWADPEGGGHMGGGGKGYGPPPLSPPT